MDVVGLTASGAAARVRALVRPLSCVNADMSAQVKVQGKALFTVGTLVRSLAGVMLHMASELAPSFEGPGAYYYSIGQVRTR
jgi:hypothetical protein